VNELFILISKTLTDALHSPEAVRGFVLKISCLLRAFGIVTFFGCVCVVRQEVLGSDLLGIQNSLDF
jgi:hypothetical protein